MSFETLQEAILTEARQRADQVSTQLTERAHAEEQRITARAQDMQEKIVFDAERDGDNQARRIRQEAELSGRALVLNAKQEELDATKARLADKILKEDATALLKGLLALVPDTEGTIVPGEVHASALKKLVKGKLKLSDTSIKGEGGFLFQAKDSELDATVGHLIDRLFVKHRAQIAKILFS